MPSFKAVEMLEHPLVSPALLELSALDQVCVNGLIGHTLARIERELILETLNCNQGNRTRSASLLGISVRSLRDKIRAYRSQGETVPDPQRMFGNN